MPKFPVVSALITFSKKVRRFKNACEPLGSGLTFQQNIGRLDLTPKFYRKTQNCENRLKKKQQVTYLFSLKTEFFYSLVSRHNKR